MEEEIINPLYQQGFNEGYIIAKHLPAFSIKRNQGLENSERGTGFHDGERQYEREKDSLLPSWLRKNNVQPQKGNADKSRGDLDSRE